jgi:hypothetical protein
LQRLLALATHARFWAKVGIPWGAFRGVAHGPCTFLVSGPTASYRLHLVSSTLYLILASHVPASRAEEDKAGPCTDDAMIVFDASGSMSGQSNARHPQLEASPRRSAVGARPSAAERHAVSPGRPRHVRPRSLQPVQCPARPQADTECRWHHHERGERAGAGGKDAADLRRGASGGGVRLSPQARGGCSRDRRRGDLREVAVRVGRATAEQLTVHVIGFRYKGSPGPAETP